MNFGKLCYLISIYRWSLMLIDISSMLLVFIWDQFLINHTVYVYRNVNLYLLISSYYIFNIVHEYYLYKDGILKRNILRSYNISMEFIRCTIFLTLVFLPVFHRIQYLSKNKPRYPPSIFMSSRCVIKTKEARILFISILSHFDAFRICLNFVRLSI